MTNTFVSVKIGNFSDRLIFLALPEVKEKVEEIEKSLWSRFPSGWSFDHPEFRSAIKNEGIHMSNIGPEFGARMWQIRHIHYGETSYIDGLQSVVESLQAHILGLEAMKTAGLHSTQVRRPEGVPMVWVH